MDDFFANVPGLPDLNGDGAVNTADAVLTSMFLKDILPDVLPETEDSEKDK